MSPKAIAALQIWSALGPLIGVGLGAFFTRSWQRKQWVLENKKAEYRELLSVLSQTVHNYLNVWPTPMDSNVITSEEMHKLMASDTEARKTIGDRIFISNFIKREDIQSRWTIVVAGSRGGNMMDYWHALHETLIKSAHRDLGIKD